MLSSHKTGRGDDLRCARKAKTHERPRGGQTGRSHGAVHVEEAIPHDHLLLDVLDRRVDAPARGSWVARALFRIWGGHDVPHTHTHTPIGRFIMGSEMRVSHGCLRTTGRPWRTPIPYASHSIYTLCQLNWSAPCSVLHMPQAAQLGHSMPQGDSRLARHSVCVPASLPLSPKSHE